ncbi:MAG: PIN domain-containing protein [Candidatus Micrarchaeota archaeon]
MKVLLDTNFLLIPFTNHVDIFEEIDRALAGGVKFILLSSTLAELRSLRGRERMYARTMLSFINRLRGKFEIVKVQGKTDEIILEYSEKNNSEEFYVATLDKELKAKLKKLKVRTIGMRGKGHVDIG